MQPTWKHLPILSFLFLLCTVVVSLAQSTAVQAAPMRSPFAVVDPNGTIFINEIHYDNTGTDENEFVEVVGPAGTDLTGWSIVLYNGASGTGYGSASPLTGIIPDMACGYGFAVVSYPVNGLQNGNAISTEPDGIVLLNSSNTVIQFLSYEGAFTAVGGLANGLSSTNIGVFEGGSDPAGRSLQLSGSGTTYGNFVWNGPNTATMGTVNTGQTFGNCDPAPSVTTVVPAANGSDVALNATVTVNFSEAVTATEPWFSLSCTTSGPHDVSISGGAQSFTIDPDVDFAYSESCTAMITGNQIVDQDGTLQAMSSDFSWTFTTVADLCVATDVTPIHTVQGSGTGSSMVGATVVVKGVVVGDFQGGAGLSGFYLQEEVGETDSAQETSEGIFIVSDLPANAGDVVGVKGLVTEVTTTGTALTELTNVIQVQVCATGASVTPITVELPVSTPDYWERFEGMVVTIPAQEQLTVIENFSLGRFGEVHLSGGDRLYQPTHLAAPGTDAQALQAANDRNRILLDDARSTQNPDPIIFPPPHLSFTNTLRAGDQVAGDVTGILDHRFGFYRIQPLSGIDFTPINLRPAEPAAVSGTLKVASANVLNYFTTLNQGGNRCGPPPPMNQQECRGANTASEFTRQRDKIINGLVEINADIVGLLEIENNPTASLDDLVAGLNAILGAGTYAYINTGYIGTDAIKVAIIYKPDAVTPVGNYAILDSAVDPNFIDTLNRPVLAQTFEENATTERFTVAVNHLKSKGSACVGDPDTGDGQGNCNVTRTTAAAALVAWLAGDPTESGDPDFLIVGDLNAYAMEDPIMTIKAAGYVDLINRFMGQAAYSYVFGGQRGYLDHALASPSLNSQVTGATEWHVNADEPAALDYNQGFYTPAQEAELYIPEPYRFSDHDPLIVGLDLATETTITIVKDAQPNNLRNFRFSGSLSNFRLDDPGFNDLDQVGASITFDVAAGTYTVSEEVPDNWHLTSITCSDANANVDLANQQVAITIVAGEQVTCTFTNEYGSAIWVDKYSDLNTDGHRSWELGLPGWQMSLYDSTGTLVSLQTTNLFGKVHFWNVAPGKYTLCETQRNGWSNSEPGTIHPTYNQPCYTLDIRPAQLWFVEFGNYRSIRAASLSLTAPDAATLDGPAWLPLEVESVDDESYEDDDSIIDPDLHRPAEGEPGPLFLPQITR